MIMGLFNGSSGGGPAGRGQAGSITTEMEVPSRKIGFVIGRGGETIRNIQNQSGARVSVSQDQRTGPTRVVVISGSADSIAIAKELITEQLTPVRFNLFQSFDVSVV